MKPFADAHAKIACELPDDSDLDEREQIIVALARIELVIQEAAESICDAIECFANRMCEHPAEDEIV